jgi:serine protease Do
MIGTQALILKNRQDARFWVKLCMLVLLASITMLTSTTVVSHAAAPRNAPASFSDVAKKVSDEVVNIQVVVTTQIGGMQRFQYYENPWGQQEGSPYDFFEKFFGDSVPREYQKSSLGSGFIIGEDGYIVTNNHVVENADEIKVKLKSGNEYPATVVGLDSSTDIALIKIEPKETLKVAELGDSEALNVGDWVVAVGSPFGYEQTITAGIISAKGLVIGAGAYDDFLQTDASINPGNSGGPLIDMNGKVVGINTAIVDIGTGIGFAIPINMAKNVIDQLKSSGEVTRGYLGVNIHDITDEDAEYMGLKNNKGALVARVTTGDPADKAGIEPQDIIIEVDGKKIEDTRDLTRMVADIPVGDTAEVVVLRNGKTKKFKVEIAKRPMEFETAGREERQRSVPTQNNLGIRVTEITPNLANRYGLAETEGVMVSQLAQNGKAAAAGLQTGDIIKEINHEAIKTIEDYNNALQNAKEKETISMWIFRSSGNGNGVYHVINIKP